MVFFLTAMIACLVIMIKNVEEERKEIGIFKALGYSNSAVAGKFILYAVLAWIIGIFIGTVMGTCVLPFVICSIYNMTYSVPNVGTVFLADYVFFGIAISLILIVAATLIAVIHEIKHNPATLMRPKNIAYNRRNILEKIPGLWGKMSYGMVVVARTISRSRERVTAGTLGIACCTALILSSLGLINSTTAVSNAQYADDGIFKYDILFVLRTPQQEDTKALKEYQSEPSTKEELESIPLLKREDIGKKAARIYNTEKDIAGVKVLHHNINTNGIGYLTLSFNMDKVEDGLLPYAGLL